MPIKFSLPVSSFTKLYPQSIMQVCLKTWQTWMSMGGAPMVTPPARHSEQLQSLKLPVSPCQPLPAWYGVCVCISGNSLLQRERRLDRSKNFVKSQAAEVVHRLHCTVVDRSKNESEKKMWVY